MTPPLGLRRVRLKKSDPISIAYLVGAASCFRRESRRRRQPPTPANKPRSYIFQPLQLSLLLDVRGSLPTLIRQKVGKNFRAYGVALLMDPDRMPVC